MRRVRIFALEPGQKVGRTIYSSMGETLLEAGVTLTPKYINTLIKMGIPYIYIDDGLLTDMVVDDTVSLETRMAAVQQVKNILLETKESGRLVIKPEAIYSTVRNFTDQLLSNKSLMVNLVDLRTQDDYTFAHSVNVCILSLMVGITLNFSREALALLGIAALLHDLGKVNIPDRILNKPANLTPEEYEIMRKHTLYGYEIIQSAKGFDATTAVIALQHHECYDGSGYPQGISGEAFLEMAQIVGIADKFDALTANRIYRKAFPAHEAYEMCAASGNFLFKANIVKAFLQNIAAYPSGSLVELNTGEFAVVKDTPRGLSRFPDVRILYDRHRRPLPLFKEISLSKTVGLSIVKVLNEEEIRSLVGQ
ncbi:HD-GYP domain-containing protein [Desulforamulus ruminis]|uniref:Metal-dependent phosphohydrolase HD sub domain protein n=1 Tax=Desulforamulus ruminis (strain ATCC 23193 / DSM 2154 / NCIMB 8452 / DL) TaxID=696281 RepID=F6DPY1_DESRL|nr:HD-GYP domain-containing protein [Desulforamulus ruminis]AEG60820.1 metal-dependent phosphohydrolase HD sub domain protein [Desulforamulus ruminis DSM 2154]